MLNITCLSQSERFFLGLSSYTTNEDPVIIITQNDIYMILGALNDPKWPWSRPWPGEACA